MDALYPLAEAVVKEATARGLTLATAESLTAGLIAATIADVPGASKTLRGGVVSYALDVKQSVLGVKGIGEDRVVSEDCAMQMAAGARKLMGADIAVSATGVAGPDGGTEDTPVGTVWIGCAYGDTVAAREHHFTGNRQAVRRDTVRQALQTILDCMKGGR
jgi:PncC family amidohydrolase